MFAGSFKKYKTYLNIKIIRELTINILFLKKIKFKSLIYNITIFSKHFRLKYL